MLLINIATVTVVTALPTEHITEVQVGIMNNNWIKENVYHNYNSSFYKSVGILMFCCCDVNVVFIRILKVISDYVPGEPGPAPG